MAKADRAEVQTGLVLQKVNDYGISDYAAKLDTTARRMPEIVRSAPFLEEMRRFLPAPVYDRTLGKERFTAYLENTVTELLREVHESMDPQPGPDFRM